MSSSPQLPNPFTPLAWVPPDIARQLLIGHCMLFGALGAWVWDCVTSLAEEFQMFFSFGVRLPDVVYILSRLSTGWLIFAGVLPGVMPTGHCHAITKSVGTAASVQFATNSLLFLFRVRAVFFGQRVVVVPFVVLWLAIVGTSLLYPITYDGTTVGTTNVCVGTRLDITSSVAVIVSAVFDTLTFLAITVRLTMSAQPSASWSSWARTLISGDGMGRVSQVMVQTGQSYYLVTVGFNVASAALILNPSIPMGYSDSMMPVSACVTNIMATTVYRRLKLGIIQDTPTTGGAAFSTTQTLQFAPRSMLSGQDGSNGQLSAGEVGLESVRGLRSEKRQGGGSAM